MTEIPDNESEDKLEVIELDDQKFIELCQLLEIPDEEISSMLPQKH